MKVTVNTKEKQFEPIELNITIESKEEYIFLICLMGAKSEDLLELANKRAVCEGVSKFKEIPSQIDVELHNILDELDIES